MFRACAIIAAACIATVCPAFGETKPPADARSHWSFQPVREPRLPAVKNTAWPRDRLDFFILAAQEKKNIQPVGDADPRTLIRRLYLDLIGLPPSVEEMERWLAKKEESKTEDFKTADSRPENDEARLLSSVWQSSVSPWQSSVLSQLVDHLLSSPAFGERWGRHWLDVSRYAESSGNTRNMTYPYAWRYRNYVIRSFNRDTPFDQFIREQIAGDLLPAASQAERDHQITGTGFLNVGPKTLGEQDEPLYQMNVADDQIDGACRAFLALTANCARCHDHKFDPITTAEYHALAGIFRSTVNLASVETNNRENDAGQHALGPAGEARLAEQKAHAGFQDKVMKDYLEVAKARKELNDQLDQGKAPLGRGQRAGLPAETQSKLSRLDALEEEVDCYQFYIKDLRDRPPPAPPIAMAVRDSDKPMDCPVYDKGEIKKPLAPVPRGALSLIPVKLGKIGPKESGRRQLADWIASPDNPLTARVIVNRVWLHLFGRGLVDTPDDFGLMGSKPSHPELLDDLTARFVRSGWSVKTLIRSIVLSRTYQLNSESGVRSAELAGASAEPAPHSKFRTPHSADPDNLLLWHMPPRRLDAEVIRDSIFAVSGQLDRRPLEGSQIEELSLPLIPKQREVGRRDFVLKDLKDDMTHRAVYMPIVRGSVSEMLAAFDVADPNLVVGARRVTTVPVQSLFLMNSDLVLQQSAAAARRLLAIPDLSDEQRLIRAFEMSLARKPSAQELSVLQAYLENAAVQAGSSADAWSEVFHALFCSGEFRTVY